jgi:hypothetical protein
MKKIQITIFTLFIFVSAAMAQNNLNYQWHKTNKEFTPLKTIIDKQGNFYMYGVFDDSLDADFGTGKTMIYANLKSRHRVYKSAYIVKYNSVGNFVWANTVKGNQIYTASDLYFNADETSVLIMGTYADSIYGLGSIETRKAAGNYDAFICRYSAQTGALERVSSVGGAGREEGAKGLFDKDGNHYIMYYQEVYTTNPQFRYIILVKANSAGSIVYNYNMGMPGTGSILLQPLGLALDSSNNAYILGEFDRRFTFNNSQNQAQSMDPEESGRKSYFLIKLNQNGVAVNWDKYGVTGSTVSNTRMAIAKNGEVYLSFNNNLSAYVLPGKDQSNAYIIKLASDLVYQWSMRLESLDNHNYNYGLTTDFSNNLYFSGLNYSDFKLVTNKTQPVWYFYDTTKADKTYSNTYSNNDGSNFILKVNKNGDVQWLKQYKNNDNSRIYEVIVNNSNDLFITGLSNTKLYPVANSDANSENLTSEAFFIV